MAKEKKKSKFWGDFKAFAMRGNMIDMAVGVIVGGAFGKIVSSLVNDILMPPIGLLIGGVDFKDLKIVLSIPDKLQFGSEPMQPATINYGMFLQNILDFLIVAMCIFLLVRFISKLTAPKEEPTPAAPAPKPDDVVLLEEIRDLLKKQNDEIEKK